MKLRNILDIIFETVNKRTYGCAMLYFKFPKITELHSYIEEEDLLTKEVEPHCTLLYGLHDNVSLDSIKKIVSKYEFGKCTINNISLFETDEYDVLKFIVSGKSIYECNSDLKKLPHTNPYDEYNPHLTVAYLKSGTGSKYVKLFNEKKIREFTVDPTYIIYSTTDKVKFKIDL